MCRIAGFFNPFTDYTKEEAYYRKILDSMNQAQKHCGPDDESTYLSDICGLAQVRLNMIDPATGCQPMQRTRNGRTCAIACDGEIYNMSELKAELIPEAEIFRTTGDTEVILEGFLRHGPDYIRKLNGIYAIALWDDKAKELHLFRDRLGGKPLFYTLKDKTLFFASEIKGLQNILEVLPGEHITFSRTSCKKEFY